MHHNVAQCVRNANLLVSQRAPSIVTAKISHDLYLELYSCIHHLAILNADIGAMEGGEEGTLVDTQKLAVSSIQKVVFDVRPADFNNGQKNSAIALVASHSFPGLLSILSSSHRNRTEQDQKETLDSDVLFFSYCC